MMISYSFPVDAEYLVKIKGPGGRTNEVRLPVKAGTRSVGVTFLAENELSEFVAAYRGTPQFTGCVYSALDHGQDGSAARWCTAEDFDIQYTTTPQLTSVTISGPFNPTEWVIRRAAKRIFVCREETESCGRQILSTLARRAYRRPVTKADISPLVGFYQNRQT